MPRTPASHTRERIQSAALELFAAQGLQQTSMRQIADRLGLTKPALYYHFASREELVRSLVQPLVDDVEELLARVEAQDADDAAGPRPVLEAFFDITYRHRAINQLAVRELSALAYLDLGTRVVGWRHRLTTLLVGADADLAARTRAVVAAGGLADCIVMFPEVSLDDLRTPAIDAACAALVGDPTPPRDTVRG
ncbi:TetR/AcrR family transcriptional regulator [Isoptericola cucumis]|uniref:TetR family transcriptional regulator n=1 Tax=Isoptericola cucumis TaxID=1776856 RepID=A0ABQ2B0S3_9MICO|nr:TetR/AcrR family transcriptional regulator [Isoptericola cucumis]GGI05099.1 TetR family transcriptional regulator [Isoptericola cucumis]